MKKILLFTGAGMSVPMGLPAAVGFADTIDKCEPNLKSLLSAYLDTDAKDIEKILYVLDEFVDGSRFFKYVFHNYSGNPNFSEPINLIARFQGHAQKFQQTVKSDIFRILQKFDSEKALKIYSNLIKSFVEYYKDFSLSVFTTNYDLIFEDIILENPQVFEDLGIEDFYFGFTSKWGKLRFNKDEDFKWSKQIIEYNKLHGSLDWSKDNKQIVVKTGAITLPAEPDTMPLLYPGYKGTPVEEPFITLHNKLYLRLIESDIVFVVGFAFRDPYINSIFEFALRSNPQLKIECYNPSPLSSLPVESAIPLFLKRNSNQFFYNQTGISERDNPLDLTPF